MDFKRVFGIIIGFIIIAALIFGLVGFVKSKMSPKKTVVSNVATDSATAVPATEVAQTVPAGAVHNNPTPTIAGTKAFQSGNAIFHYPQNWGVLTCTTSNNFEFIPNGGDQKIACDVAREPITVVLNSQVGCVGENVVMSGMSVTRSKITNARGTDYRWCFSTGGNQYNVTHRVSQGGSRGTSKDDYSSQIEQMISRINQPGGGS